jgi:predicted dehydrogenase
MRATGKPEFPSRVVCLGTRKITPDRDVSDNTQVLAEFPNGMTLIVTSSSVNEQGLNETIRGQYGTMYLSTNGSSLEYKPERPFAEEFDPESFTNLTPSGNTTPQHHKNWLDCIRNGGEPVAGIDLAIKVQTVISLAEISDRRGTMAHFDPKTRKITDGSGREIKAYDYAEEAKLEHGPYGPIREIGS